jgi:hypothetical protein
MCERVTEIDIEHHTENTNRTWMASEKIDNGMIDLESVRAQMDVVKLKLMAWCDTSSFKKLPVWCSADVTCLGNFSH